MEEWEFPDPAYGREPLYITFSDPVSTEALTAALTLVPEIPLEIARSGQSGKKFLVRPVNCWIPETTFVLTLDASLEEMHGITLEDVETAEFSTLPFEVIQTSPVCGSIGADIGRDFSLRLSAYAQGATIPTAVSLEPDSSDYTLEWSNNNGICTVIFNLGYGNTWQPNTEYTVTVDTTLLDFTGRPLTEPFICTFTTGE